MNVLLGCAPGTRLIFDLNSTLQYARKEFGIIYDCPVTRADPDMPCFYYKQGRTNLSASLLIHSNSRRIPIYMEIRTKIEKSLWFFFS